jgi:hypothetical protein
MTNMIVTHAGFGQPGVDQPLLDTTVYGSGPEDSVTDVTEAAAITHHTATIGGVPIAYTATAGHLVAVDPASSKPAAKFFYVAFTADGAAPSTRPVTFFYNGGPPRFIRGVPAAWIVCASPHQDQHAGLHAASAVYDGGQS